MEIKILGSGCTNCKKLEANKELRLSTLGVSIKQEKAHLLLDDRKLFIHKEEYV